MQSVVAGQAPITLEWKNISHVCMCVGVFRQYKAVRGRRTGSNSSGVEECLVCMHVPRGCSDESLTSLE